MTAAGAEWPPPKPDPAPPDVRRFYRRTALVCLAAFAVSWLYGYATTLLPLKHFTLSFLYRPAVEWLSLDFWVGALPVQRRRASRSGRNTRLSRLMNTLSSSWGMPSTAFILRMR